ncbi:alpha/beta hydrolase [uncultured archaeon]|nr:alpha/beta hydrolase [uncultured archaeon]
MQQLGPERRFQSSFGEIAYDIKGGGSPIVLVHGTPWSSFSWRHLIPPLSQWFKVYYYDLLGYGASEKRIGDVSLGVQNKVFCELLDYWGLEAPVAIGHDFGGTTILRAHLLDGRSFDKIILIDPVAIAPWGSDFFTHVKSYENAFKNIPPYIHKALISTYVLGAKYKSVDEKTLNGLIEPWLGPTGQPAFYRQIAQSSQKYTDEIENEYTTIRTTVLIVWGEEDSWIPIEKGHKLNNAIKDSEFVQIAESGHLVMEDQPTILLSHILKLLI